MADIQFGHCRSLIDENATEDAGFERIRRKHGGRMPVSCHTRSVRSSRKSWSSRRNSRRISRQVGGCHRRRQRRF